MFRLFALAPGPQTTNKAYAVWHMPCMRTYGRETPGTPETIMDAKTFDKKRLTERHVTKGPNHEPRRPCRSAFKPISKPIGHSVADSTMRRHDQAVPCVPAMPRGPVGLNDPSLAGGTECLECANPDVTGIAMAQARRSHSPDASRYGFGWKTEINLFAVAETANSTSYIAEQTSGKQAQNLTSTRKRDPQCGMRSLNHACDDMGTARDQSGSGADVNYAWTGGAFGDSAVTYPGGTMEKICYADQ